MNPSLISLLIGVPGGCSLLTLCLVNPEPKSTTGLMLQLLTGVFAGIAVSYPLVSENALSWVSLALVGVPGVFYRIYRGWK